MSAQDHFVFVNQNGTREAEFPDTGFELRRLFCRVCAGMAGPRLQIVRPAIDDFLLI
jgi:hypothetical protein